ncbi:hypothetical protein Tco_1360841 [Tanacetum coccineum]
MKKIASVWIVVFVCAYTACLITSITIRKYMYNDVLRYKDVHKIFDCSYIQLSNVTASPSGRRLYADSSNYLERSLLVSGSECVVSAESSVEENSTVATTCDETVYECVDSVKGVHPPYQKRSATTSRKLLGRKCVPQRSPLF